MAAVLFVLYIPADEISVSPQSSPGSKPKKHAPIEEPPQKQPENGENGDVSDGKTEEPDKNNENTAPLIPTQPQAQATCSATATVSGVASEDDQRPLLVDDTSENLDTHTEVQLPQPSSGDSGVGLSDTLVNDKPGTEPEVSDVETVEPNPRTNREKRIKKGVSFLDDEQLNWEDGDAKPFKKTKSGSRRTYYEERVTLLESLQNVLRHSGIEKDVWTKTKLARSSSNSPNQQQSFWQVTFIQESKRCDGILRALTSLGLGRIPDTSVSVHPANLYYAGPSRHSKQSVPAKTVDEKTDFVESVKSKLTVAQVVHTVKSNACLTFDYVMFVLLASFIAGMGLAENSSVILVASMLISPIMGPILGGVFGWVVKSEGLWKMGIRNELFSLAMCLFCGSVFGLITSAVNSEGANWGSTDQWPTPEMKSRGELRSLWVGIVVALLSGAGVALSILGGNAGSLVGVAISASLLPPAVNAGMLWTYAVVSAIHPPPHAVPSVGGGDMNNSGVTPPPHPHPPDCPPLQDNAYQFVHSCNMAEEAAALAAISLLLTLVNIVCIIVMGILVLKFKEVAPHTTVVAVKEEGFWKKDIKVARDLYKTLKGPDSVDLAKLARQIAKQYKEEQEETAGDDEDDLLAGIRRGEEFDQLMAIATDDPEFKKLLSNEYADCSALQRKHHTYHGSSMSQGERATAQELESRLQEASGDKVEPAPKVKPQTAPVTSITQNPFFKDDAAELEPLVPIPEDDFSRRVSDAGSMLSSKDTQAEATDKEASSGDGDSTPVNTPSGLKLEIPVPGGGGDEDKEATPGEDSMSTLGVPTEGGMKKSESIGRFAITQVDEPEAALEDVKPLECPDTPTEAQGGIQVMDN